MLQADSSAKASAWAAGFSSLQPLATVIAALIAASAAYAIGRHSEYRAAHRAMLSAELPALSAALHQLLAATHVLAHRYAKGLNDGDWRAKANNAATELKRARERLRYPLWGIHEAIGSIARLPSWYGHLKTSARSETFLNDADVLRHAIDQAIRRAYLKGRPPTRFDAWRTRRIQGQFEKHWNEFVTPQVESDAQDA